MPATKMKGVSVLTLDLKNYRTPPQPSETAALKAMITTDPDHFWALVASLADSGFLPTENIIVLDKEEHSDRQGRKSRGSQPSR